jgi:hypothetical protein
MPATEKKVGTQMTPDLQEAFRALPGEMKANWRDAAILWISIQKFPLLREGISTVARTLEVPAAVKEVQAKLVDWVSIQMIAEDIARRPRAERAAAVADLRARGVRIEEASS